MEEQRTYPREELVAAMICSMIAKRVSTYCIVRSVGLDSAEIEWPLADEMPDLLEVDDLVALGDILSGSRALFRGDVGKIRWVYKRTVGLKFETLLKESQEDLRNWLEEQELV